MQHISALPKWIQERYAILWAKKNTEPFTHEEAMKMLKEKEPVLISVFLSELRKAGWLEAKLDKKDARRRIYTLIQPEQIFMGMAQGITVEISK